MASSHELHPLRLPETILHLKAWVGTFRMMRRKTETGLCIRDKDFGSRHPPAAHPTFSSATATEARRATELPHRSGLGPDATPGTHRPF